MQGLDPDTLIPEKKYRLEYTDGRPGGIFMFMLPVPALRTYFFVDEEIAKRILDEEDPNFLLRVPVHRKPILSRREWEAGKWIVRELAQAGGRRKRRGTRRTLKVRRHK